MGAKPDHTVYRYHNGAALLGKELTLEAEEIGGERVLKCRFLATNEPPPKETETPDGKGPFNRPADASEAARRAAGSRLNGYQGAIGELIGGIDVDSLQSGRTGHFRPLVDPVSHPPRMDYLLQN